MPIVVQMEEGDTLSNLTLLTSSFEPSGCSIGDEQYTIVNSRRVILTHLLVGCTAKISLAAEVAYD